MFYWANISNMRGKGVNENCSINIFAFPVCEQVNDFAKYKTKTGRLVQGHSHFSASLFYIFSVNHILLVTKFV